LLESGDDEEPGNTIKNERQWRTHIIRQALAETCESTTLSSKFRDLHAKLDSILGKISEKHDLITQTQIDDIYAEILVQIEPSRATRATKRKRVEEPSTQAGCRRRRRR